MKPWNGIDLESHVRDGGPRLGLRFLGCSLDLQEVSLLLRLVFLDMVARRYDRLLIASVFSVLYLVLQLGLFQRVVLR